MPHRSKLSPLSQAIRFAMNEAGITMKKLGDELGITESAVSKMITNSSYSAKQLEAISRILKLEFNFQNGELPKLANGSHDADDPRHDIKFMIEMMQRVISAQADALKAKDDLISTLKEKQKE